MDDKNVYYAIYTDDGSNLRGININGERPTHVVIYVLSSYVSSEGFKKFVQEAAKSLAYESDPEDVNVRIIHTDAVPKVMEAIAQIKHREVHVHAEEIALKDRRIVELERVLNLGIWGYIQYRFDRFLTT